MADNVAITAGAGTNIAAHEVTFSGDTTKLSVVALMHVSGSEGSKTANEVFFNGAPALAAYGMVVRPAPCSAHHLVTAATDNAGSVKAAPGALRAVHAFNDAAYPIYIKFHNTAGTPTAGAGIIRTVAVQAGQSRDVTFPGGGLLFATGIGITVVKDIADSGTTAVAASDAVIEVIYE
jgi:hypothetical protein